MRVGGWVWYAVYGVGFPLAGAATIFYGRPWQVLFFLAVIPVGYFMARQIFRKRTQEGSANAGDPRRRDEPHRCHLLWEVGSQST